MCVELCCKKENVISDEQEYGTEGSTQGGRRNSSVTREGKGTRGRTLVPTESRSPIATRTCFNSVTVVTCGVLGHRVHRRNVYLRIEGMFLSYDDAVPLRSGVVGSDGTD